MKNKKLVKLRKKIKRVMKRFFTKQDFEKLSKDFFDKKAPIYDKEELKLYSADSCIAIADAIKSIKYKSLLDVGCGTGHLIYLLSQQTKANYVGIDLSSKMIEEAYKKKIKNATFIEGSATKLPFSKKTFDIVTCSESFHHYLEADKAIKEVYRVLKKGGYYIVADKNVSRFIWYHNFFNRRFKNTGDCNFSNLKRTKKALQKNGFEIQYSGKYSNNSHYIIVGRK